MAAGSRSKQGGLTTPTDQSRLSIGSQSSIQHQAKGFSFGDFQRNSGSGLLNWKLLSAVLGGLLSASILLIVVLVHLLLAGPRGANPREAGAVDTNGVAGSISVGESNFQSMQKLEGATPIDLDESNKLLHAELAQASDELAAAQAALRLLADSFPGGEPTEGSETEAGKPLGSAAEAALALLHSEGGSSPPALSAPPPPPQPPTAVLALKVREFIAECLHLEALAKEAAQELNYAWQRWSTAVREAKWRNMVVEKVEWLDAHKEYEKMDAEKATEQLATLEGEKRKGLEEFLNAYLPNQQWWNNSEDPKMIPELHKWREEGQQAEQHLAGLQKEAERSVQSLEASLWDKCRMRIAGWNWTQAFEQVLKVDTQSGKKNPNSVDQALRSQPGLKARESSWKQHPKLYPDPALNVTFLLQYFKQPQMIHQIVTRLYACTEGHLGQGQLPGITTELMVNVDEADEMQQWYEAWRETDNGSFVVPVFNHNVHENRGYNNLANMARGEYIILIQDDDIPPENCSWLTKVLTVYKTWPRVGIVGLQTGRISTQGHVWSTPEAFLRPGKDPIFNRLYDPVTNIRMYFASVVDVGPMIIKRDLWLELGGFPEDYCREGESCIIADWQFVLRSWLAGHQVVHVFSEPGLAWVLAAQGGTHKAGYGFSSRLQNLEINTQAYEETYVQKYSQRLVQEVKRLNGYMRAVPQWQ